MDYLDASIDSMENSRFVALFGGLIRELMANTHLSQTDINCLLMVYYKFAKANGPSARKMKKVQFYQLFLVMFKVSNVQTIDRTLFAVTRDVKYVSPQAWVQLFSLYTTKDLSVRMRFAFKIYDTKGTGFIDREQISLACEKFFTGEDEDEITELRADMGEFMIKKFDVDKDGLISFEDYSTVVSEQPCLLEFLGWLFPNPDDREIMAHCINMDSILTDSERPT
ncbi:EF-hand calcium-binding domain-containing protein 1-like [Drosophila obscura]|uniref:EF-hand calcium-binding domain-containing protein 1-like n=1 Tax=Drosophila obscura TaxID=7282 RepID=UPI000B9FF7CA|nr:EF-hand calcium-binding domain-containing protein 1-like [Drosophila obscura]